MFIIWVREDNYSGIEIDIDWHRLWMIMRITWGTLVHHGSCHPTTLWSSALVPVPSPRLFNEVLHKVQMSIVGCLTGPWDHVTNSFEHYWLNKSKIHKQYLQKQYLGTATSTTALLEQQRKGPRAKVFCLGSPQAHMHTGPSQMEFVDRWSILEVDGSSFLHQSLHNHLATNAAHNTFLKVLPSWLPSSFINHVVKFPVSQ